ncbi:MAG: VWA domain-containing protein [Armatimonadetes bacterium]|nr:VWA domain-containing protein [Armatimonadota bacterium]
MIRFADSMMLIFLWAVAAMIAAWILGAHRRLAALKTLGSLEVVQRMAASLNPKRRRLKTAMLVGAATSMVVALARPQLGTRLETVKRKGVDLLIAMDVSNSMLAQDLKPSRLEAAKQEVAALTDRLQGDRLGLVAFAGNAFVECPLTLDYGAARMFLDDIEPGLIPQPGTAIGEAIRTATKAFSQQERKYKVLILVTDGEDHDTKPVDAAKEAAKQGVRIYTIGVGSTEGEPVPQLDEQGRPAGYRKDREGNIVLSKLDETTLQKIALATNGKYYHATSARLELDRVYREVSKLEEKELLTRKFSQYEDRFQVLLLAAFCLLFIERLVSERRYREVTRG